MEAKLITYDLSNLNQYRKVLVNRALFGYNDHSNKGAYTYKRAGILKEIPHLRLLRGAIIIEKSKQNKVVDILKKYKAKYFIFTIKVNRAMLH